MDDKYKAVNCHMGIQAVEKTREGRNCLGGYCRFNWVDIESLSNEVESEQKLERGEGGSCEVMGASGAVRETQRWDWGREGDLWKMRSERKRVGEGLFRASHGMETLFAFISGDVGSLLRGRSVLTARYGFKVEAGRPVRRLLL